MGAVQLNQRFVIPESSCLLSGYVSRDEASGIDVMVLVELLTLDGTRGDAHAEEIGHSSTLDGT
ncbi:MAG TPA: hypothetical protein VHV82_03650 [Sporichthyaceae bacterium]|nr:hypothetical protein [Sporichthyaceae bacterium]